MNIQKIVLIILGLGMMLGLGFAVFAVVQEGNVKIPVKIPETPVGDSVTNSPEFGKSIALKLNDKITFSDGLDVILQEINDSRCPDDPLVKCIWAGEISGNLTVSGGQLSVSKNVRLGTVNNQSVILEGYTFFLKDATTTSVILIVQKN